MPIKKLTFSFDVPLTSLLGLIATGQADMRIDVLGDDKPLSNKALAAAGIAGLLAPPKSHGNTGVQRARGKDPSGKPKTAQTAMLEAMAQAPDLTLPLAAMRTVVAALGLAPGSANSQISVIGRKGWAVNTQQGIYSLTPAGLEECKRRGLAPEPAKPPKPSKPSKPTKPQKAAAVNGAAHHG